MAQSVSRQLSSSSSADFSASAVRHSFPRRDVRHSEVFSQKTLDLATAHLLSWRQGPGSFGGLYFHACWGISGVLQNRYQGPTTWPIRHLMLGFMKLFDRTGDLRWRTLADECVSQILYLQEPAGGFRHANSQDEPAYSSRETCPILQGLPLLALLDYATWPSADPRRVELIRPALDAHWMWFERTWWRHGNSWLEPLPFAGFCGVTNQDLVIVAVLARYAVVYGDASRYENFGRPTLETYLSPRYYHEKIGVFERGDEANFVERTTYNEVIIPMLEIIQEAMPDPRLPGVIDNVSAHLFDAIQPGPDGLSHLAWGPNIDAVDKSKVKDWIGAPHGVYSYPLMIRIMADHLKRRPNPQRQAQLDALQDTVAAYVFGDGSLPLTVGATDSLFNVSPSLLIFWADLIDRLGAAVRSPLEVKLPVVHRTCGNVTWKSDDRHWSLGRDGRREFAGLKEQSLGIIIGPEENIAGANFTALDQPEILETVATTR